MPDPARPEGAHADRDRAESFGAVAADYDRYRPSYPADLVDALVAAAGGGPVLDVGAGTGRAASLLSARGLEVVGVEVDAAMAALARAHGLDVEVSDFERWDPAGRRFSLITSAQAWHWVDPVVGPRKARGLLLPGGTLTLFWNFSAFGAATEAAVAGAYARHVPDLGDGPAARHGGPGTVPGHIPALEAAGLQVRVEQYEWTELRTPHELVARTATYSDHSTLPGTRRTALMSALRDAWSRTADADGRIPVSMTTHVLWAADPAAGASLRR